MCCPWVGIGGAGKHDVTPRRRESTPPLPFEPGPADDGEQKGPRLRMFEPTVLVFSCIKEKVFINRCLTHAVVLRITVVRIYTSIDSTQILYISLYNWHWLKTSTFPASPLVMESVGLPFLFLDGAGYQRNRIWVGQMAFWRTRLCYRIRKTLLPSTAHLLIK